MVHVDDQDPDRPWSDGRDRPADQQRAHRGVFAFHFGLFTLVHGVFSFIIAGLSGGFTGGPRTWLLLLAAILASHLVSLGLNWFGQGERDVVSPQQAMVVPYPRMLVLHLSVIGGFFLLLGVGRPDSTYDDVAPVALLCGMKTLVDVFFHVRERLANRKALRGTLEQ